MMFISKFNGMIRNRIVWGIIAFVIVMAFVVWGTQTDGGKADSAANSPGTLDGKHVKMDDFRHAYFNTWLSMCMSFGRRINITGEMDAALRGMAWRRLCALRAAGKMEVGVANDEVADAIRSQPFFVVDGRFSRDRYNAFIAGFLAEIGATEPQFEEFIRQELILSKMRFILAQSVWVSAPDAWSVFRQLYDTFTVQYVSLMRDELDHRTKISDEDGWVLFNLNPARFALPEMMSVKYVSFPVADFMDEAAVTEDMLLKYYDEYITARLEAGSDDWEDVPSLDDVEDEVRLMAASREAELAALDKASAFEVALAPDRSGLAPSFDEAAEAAGLTVFTSPLFAVDEPVPGVDAGLDFNEGAFRLRPTPDESFSYPVKGEKSVYVLSFKERVDSRVPEFSEVKEEVMLAARDEATQKMLKELAEDVRAAIADDLEGGVSFADAVSSFGLELFDMEPFTVTARMADFDDSDESYNLIRNVLSCNPGELTELIPLRRGVLLGYVQSREPADGSVYASIGGDLVEYIRDKRQETIFDSWQGWLLSSADFTDLARQRESAAESDDWSDEDDEPESGG